MPSIDEHTWTILPGEHTFVSFDFESSIKTAAFSLKLVDTQIEWVKLRGLIFSCLRLNTVY
jgi:hypothetical protein